MTCSWCGGNYKTRNITCPHCGRTEERANRDLALLYGLKARMAAQVGNIPSDARFYAALAAHCASTALGIYTNNSGEC